MNAERKRKGKKEERKEERREERKGGRKEGTKEQRKKGKKEKHQVHWRGTQGLDFNQLKNVLLNIVVIQT